MPCDVFFYTDALAPLHPPSIEIVAFNQRDGQMLDSARSSTRLGPEAIARLKKFPRKVVFSLFAHDATYSWAPATVENLNGATLGRIDLVLYPLPGGGAGPTAADSVGDDEMPIPPVVGNPPTEATEIAPYLDDQPWHDREKAAVRSLVRAFGALSDSIDDHARLLIEFWGKWLEAVGIRPELLASRSRAHAEGGQTFEASGD